MKKILSLVLALVLVLGSFPVAFADAATDGAQLQEWKVVQGDLMGDKELTREMLYTYYIRLLGEEEAALAFEAPTTFTDVPATHWAAKYVAYAEAKGYTLGVGGGLFGLGQVATTEQLATIMLRGLGYTDQGDAKDFEYANAIAKATEMGLLEGTDLVAGQALIRSNGFVVLANTLDVAKKGSTDALKYELGLAVKPAPAAKATGAMAIDATTVKVMFDAAVTPAAADFAVTDAKDAAVAVSSVSAADAGMVAVLKVAELTIGSKYTVAFGGESFEVVPTTKDDTTKPALDSAVAVTGTLVRATFATRNINKDTLVAANFTLNNDATVASVELDTATMAKDGQENNTVVLLNVTGLSAGKAFTLTSKNVASYEGAVATTSTTTFAGKDADKTAPKVAGAVSEAGYKVIVTFTEDGKVNESGINVANYTLDPALEITKAEFRKNNLGENVVVLYTADQKAGTAYTLKVNNISDGTNTMTAEAKATFAGITKATNQVASSAVATDATKVTVTFKYDANDTALNVANYTMNNSITVTAAEFKKDVTEADGLNQKQVILTTSAMKSGTAYTLTVGTGVQDELGQGIKEATKLTFAGKDADTAFGSVSAVAADKNTVTVTFGEEVDRASARKVANYSFSDLGYPSSVSLNAAGTIATLKVQTMTAGKSYTLTVNNIKDLAGNVVKADTKATFTGKGDVISDLRLTGATALANNKIKLTFNQTVAGTADAGDFTLTNTSTSGEILTVTAAAATEDYIILTVDSTTKLNSSSIYKIVMLDADNDIKGALTNHFPLNTSHDEVTFVGSSSTEYTFGVASVVALDKTHVKVTFDEAVSMTVGNTTAGVLTLYTNSAMTTGAIASKAYVAPNIEVIQSADGKSVTFEMASALADNTVYYAKLNRAYDSVTPANFATADGALLKQDTGEVFKSVTIVTGVLNAVGDNLLDIASATMIDKNTLEVKFSSDVTGVAVNNLTIHKIAAATDTAVTTSTNYKMVDSQTVRYYFANADVITGNASGIYYAKVAAVTTLVGGNGFASGKNIESFAVNNATNAKPAITLVEPLTNNKIKVTVSEDIFDNPVVGSVDRVDAADFVIYNDDTNGTIDAVNITLAYLSATNNKSFTLELAEGVFLTGANYRIGLAANVTGIDDQVDADAYVPATSETANSVNFGGIATTATTYSIPTTTGGTNSQTALVMTFTTNVYNKVAGVFTELADADQKASFTKVGTVTLTSGNYVTAGNTVTWALAGSVTNDTLAPTANTLFDAAGNVITGTSTYNATGTIWTK